MTPPWPVEEPPQDGATSWGGPRTPSPTLVVDANIVLSVVLGRRSRPVYEQVVERRTVLTSARAVEEILGVLTAFPVERQVADALLAGGAVQAVEETVYAGLLDDAGRALRLAVASRNGSVADAHLLACAWAFDADLWTHDRDFAGTGWPSWSNANLREALEPARA